MLNFLEMHLQNARREPVILYVYNRLLVVLTRGVDTYCGGCSPWTVDLLVFNCDSAGPMQSICTAAIFFRFIIHVQIRELYRK